MPIGKIARRADVLVIGTSVDSHVDAVLAYIPKSIACARLNVDRYPRFTEVTFTVGAPADVGLWMVTEEGAWDLSSVRVVWFRRLGSPGIDPAIANPAYRSFALSEAEALLVALAHLLEDRHWVSPYAAVKRACAKPYQLLRARECGLSIPTTLVTNSPKTARDFLHQQRGGSTIYKTLYSPSVQYPSHRTLIFTHLLAEGDLDRLEEVQHAPCVFQPFVPKQCELRITVIGHSFHTVRIDGPSGSAAVVDWRAEGFGRLRYSVEHLPPETSARLNSLFEVLGLEFGAVDMIVTPEDEYVFLEVNPHGAWLWLEEALHMDISSSLAAYLVSLVDR